MRIISIQDLRDIVVGATFLGSGGGGSPENGLKLVDEISKVTGEVKLVSPDEVSDNEYVAMIAGMGAPKALKEKGFGPEALYAFEGLERLYSMVGIKFRYIMPGETGGFNTITPIYVAAIKKLTIVDADGTGGRAVPELGTTLYNLYCLPVSPFVVADKVGNIVAGWLANPLDGHTAEEIARHVTVAFGMLAGLGTWVVSGWQIKQCLEPNVISRSLEIGRTIRTAKEQGKDPVNAVLKQTGAYLLFKGVVKKVEIKTVAGFDFGRSTLEGLNEFKGKEFYVDFKNENMIAWKGPGEPAAMVPDLICLLTLGGEAITNADLSEGMKIAILGLPASERWRKHPKAFDVWRHILERMGYTRDYIPIEKLNP
ncbi:MAG: DUF917 domain-containing protein [Candidatus Nezhaarchaeota archaeon]|nr:DUF917 domain-containing protein [Candidatus Nezhaarchaeota archaeon]MCX8141174.1 DUF917 domain-containing protein [Candidatus Nezhaarchaeota archaeon]MDW8050823.1 DUF917 domain-containing protein [Nitrososphaerota archaeon]